MPTERDRQNNPRASGAVFATQGGIASGISAICHFKNNDQKISQLASIVRFLIDLTAYEALGKKL